MPKWILIAHWPIVSFPFFDYRCEHPLPHRMEVAIIGTLYSTKE
jgi:hypothetical protein